MVTIKVKTKELKETLKLLKGAMPGKRGKNFATTCEITVTDGNAAFAVPGAVFPLPCTTQGTCKATVPFLHFSMIVKDLIPKETEISISEGSIKINTVTISAKTTF